MTVAVSAGAGREAPAAPRHRSLRSRKKREAALAYLFILPALLIFSVFVFYPFLRNFKLALYENPPYPNLPSHYVGLHQAATVLVATSAVSPIAATTPSATRQSSPATNAQTPCSATRNLPISRSLERSPKSSAIPRHGESPRQRPR